MTGATMLTSAAVFRGELHRIVIAAGVVLLILFLVWAIEEWRIRKSGAALSWFGLSCLGLVGFAAAALLVVGLL